MIGYHQQREKCFYFRIFIPVFLILIFLYSSLVDLFADELNFNFNNNNNIEYDSQKVEVYKGKLRLSPTGFWINKGHIVNASISHDLFQDSKKNLFLITHPPAIGTSVWKSTNYGTNWISVYNNSWCGLHSIIEISINSNLYACAFDAGGLPHSNGIWKSTNHGNNWFISYGKNYYDTSSILEDHNHNIYFQGENGQFFKSTNNGTSWVFISSNTNNLIFYSLFELNNGDLLAQSTNSLYLSTDFGTNWSLINGTSGLGSFSYSRGGFLRASDNSIYVYGDSIGRSVNEGKTWEQVSDDECFKLVESSDGIFYKTYNTNVWKSFDKGYTWQKTFSIIHNLTNYNCFKDTLIKADDGKIYIAAGCRTPWPVDKICCFCSGYFSSSQAILYFSPQYVLKWFSFTKSDILNNGSIIYEFAYSTDKGNNWSDWLPPTDYNLQNVKCLGNGEDRLKIQITLNSLDHDKTLQVDWVSLQYDDGYKDNLDNIVMAPNPFRPYKDNIDYVMFFNLPEEVKISIYSVGGGKVFDKKINSIAGRYKWDVKNNSGKNLKSGVYLCCVKDNKGDEKFLKLVVIR